jgi:hypothetical protein
MGRMVAIALIAAALAPAAGASEKLGFAFGRVGGNIRPYTITIDNDGRIRVSGPVEVGRRKIASVELANLNRVAITTRFTVLEPTYLCPGTLPDVAGRFIRVGAHIVHVHGTCVPRFERMWTALRRAAKVQQS